MEKHYGFIYLTIDLKNGKGYVGQHKIKDQETLDPEYIGSGRIIGDIKKKYGIKRFHRQILHFCENQEELNEKEIEYIAYFNAIESENFYNIAEGGTGGYKCAGKTLEEMEEIRKKISIKVSGENNPMYGKNCEDYMTKEAIKEKRKNQSKASKIALNKPEVKKKISKAVKITLNKPEVRKKQFY